MQIELAGTKKGNMNKAVYSAEKNFYVVGAIIVPKE
jgi:hypothetical protein